MLAILSIRIIQDTIRRSDLISTVSRANMAAEIGAIECPQAINEMGFNVHGHITH
jgi:hypothetical protein